MIAIKKNKKTQKNPMKPKKTEKTQKNHRAAFLKKTRFLANPDYTMLVYVLIIWNVTLLSAMGNKIANVCSNN